MLLFKWLLVKNGAWKGVAESNKKDLQTKIFQIKC